MKNLSNNATKNEFDEFLQQFYVEVRKIDGTLYSKGIFLSLRSGIQRKMKEHFDIVNDPEFTKSNTIFQAQCVQLKKQTVFDRDIAI